MKRKFLLAAVITVAAITLVVATVLTTMAYLTASTAVSNTFTVGNIGIEMFESTVDTNGQKKVTDENAKKTSNGNSYHLVPATTYCKDPTIYVQSGGVESYLFVKIRNQIADIEEKQDNMNTLTMHEQMVVNGWKQIAKTATGDIYVYAGLDTSKNATTITPKSDGTTIDINVFETFSVKHNITQAELAKFAGSKVTLNAFAIQADAFAEKDNEGNKTYDSVKSIVSAWNGICQDITFETETLTYDENTTFPIDKIATAQ